MTKHGIMLGTGHVGKSSNKKGKAKPTKRRISKDIEGSYTALGSTPREAYENVLHRIYLWSNRRGQRGDEEFKGKHGNYVSYHFFEMYGGSFDVDYYINGNPNIYVVRGTVSRKGKEWIANAELLGAKTKG